MDRVTGEWVDADTSFLSVACYRKLAENAATCLRKGDPVVVRGRVSVRNYEDKNGLQRTSVEVDATSVGHDLSRGVAQFQRVRPQTGMTAMEYRAAEEGLAGSEAIGPDSMGAMSAPGEPGGEMFDEDAVAVLARDAVSVSAPF
jgi:single-strand DNA-binding protein